MVLVEVVVTVLIFPTRVLVAIAAEFDTEVTVYAAVRSLATASAVDDLVHCTEFVECVLCHCSCPCVSG